MTFPHLKAAGLEVRTAYHVYSHEDVIVAREVEDYLAKRDMSQKSEKCDTSAKHVAANDMTEQSVDVFTDVDFLDCNDRYSGGVEMFASARAAKIANRLLKERGQVVYHDNASITYWTPVLSERHTHVGLLVAVRPIEKDTAESLLRELLAHADSFPNASFRERARKVVEGV